MARNVLDILKGQVPVEEPMEFESFPSLGFIGQVTFGRYWSFMSQKDLSTKSYAEFPPYQHQEKVGDWFRYYYDKREHAQVAMEEADPDSQFSPQAYAVIQMPVKTVINTDTSSFQNQNFTGSVAVPNTLRGKTAYQWHHITLPALVAAMGKALEYDVDIFDLEELTTRDVIVTKELEERLIGTVANPHDCTLWKRREALWTALGEDNADTWTLNAKKRKRDGTEEPASSNAKSEDLRNVLQCTTFTWPEPMWGRVQLVTNPKVGQVSKSSGKQLSLTVITELFLSKKDAEAAVDKDLQMIAQSKPDVPFEPDTQSEVKEYPIPSDWDGMSDEWLSQVGEYLETPEALLQKKVDVSKLGCTWDEFKATWDYLKSI